VHDSALLRRWQVRVFAATWLSYFGYYFARKPFYIAKASLADTFGWSASTLGLLGGIYLFTYALGQFLSGAAGSRFGPRKILLGGMAVSILANAWFGFANSTATFAVLMGLNGLAQSTGWSNNVASMAPWFRREQRGTVMGIWATNFQVGGVAANTLAAFLLGWAGYRYAFLGGSVVLLAVWTFFLFNQRDKPEDVGLPSLDEASAEEENGGGWTRQIAINVGLLGVFYFFVKFIRYALWSWAPFLLQRFHGLDGDDAGYLSTAFDLAGIAGVITLGILSDRLFGGRRVAPSMLFMAAMVASCGLLYWAGAESVSLFTISLAAIGFSLYGPDAILTSAGAIDVGTARTAALAAGIVNGMGSVGGLTQEFLLGALLDSGDVRSVFAVLLISAAAALASLGVLVWRGRQGLSKI